MDTILEVKNITKTFEKLKALDDVSISIKRGEFITLLGPSGCGKTTLLKIIAGLLTPDKGSIILNGIDVTDMPPNKRNVNTVFQNYALFPHMNVGANVAYGLKIKGLKKSEINKRVSDMLKLVQLEGFEKKNTTTLSGGQKQRVAIARAAVNEPDVLLLDEPLGALDLQLRRYLQGELKELQRKLGITFIYITHDQEEAMNMSDRIVVMKDGKFCQTGTPAQVYDNPRTEFVAKFVGMANIINGEVMESHDGYSYIMYEDSKLKIKGTAKTGSTVKISVRSENLHVAKEPCENAFAVTADSATYTNGILRLTLNTKNGEKIVSARQGGQSMPEGTGCFAYFSPENAVILEDEI